MKKIIINILNLVLIVTCLIVTTYGWWIDGLVGDDVIIKSAKIDSIITLEKGADFNKDGLLDIDSNGDSIFEEVSTTDKGKEQVIVLEFADIIPTEVYTWRVTVLNKGDVAGYVYADFYDDIDFTDGISKEEEFLRFMSISTIVEDEAGNKIVNKRYFNGLTSDAVLFGGTENDLVELGGSIQIEFRITFELFDDLLEKGICNENDRADYLNLQGKTFNTGFKFLDISLSSYPPPKLTIPILKNTAYNINSFFTYILSLNK